MDKLRALQFFIAAAEERSLSGAARRFDVSVPAVSKLIASLEGRLGVRLFDRNAQGLTLTSSGDLYLQACRPLFDQLEAADDALREEASSIKGSLVIGAPQMLAQHCLLPALPRLHARFPDLHIDVRDTFAPSDTEARAVDVYVQWGWMEASQNLVRRRIAQSRFLVCAAPGYWAKFGIPGQPMDLERHTCFLFRTTDGTVHDLWQFERDGAQQAVAARGWLVSNYRDVALDAALAGEGVARLTDLTIRAHIRSGRLVPVLLDWEMRDAPPVDLLYHSHQKRVPRIRLFIDFVTELFREMEAERDETGAHLRHERPRWWARRGLASAALAERDRRTK